MTSGGAGAETKARVAPSPAVVATPAPAGLSATPTDPASHRNTKVSPAHEGRGSAVNLGRDQLVRHALLVADMAAFVAALVVLAQFSSKSPRLTWVSVCGLLALLLGAKIFGLYDRDEVLLHKTTLDEAPKLFQVATLGALCVWLAGGFVVVGGTLDRREALLLWLMLIFFLIIARACARAMVLRVAPIERFRFIGDHGAAKTI